MLFLRCSRQGMWRVLIKSLSVDIKTGQLIENIIPKVQRITGPGRMNQESRSHSKVIGGRTLRRKLSKIFHLATSGRSFLIFTFNEFLT